MAEGAWVEKMVLADPGRLGKDGPWSVRAAVHAGGSGCSTAGTNMHLSSGAGSATLWRPRCASNMLVGAREGKEWGGGVTHARGMGGWRLRCASNMLVGARKGEGWVGGGPDVRAIRLWGHARASNGVVG